MKYLLKFFFYIGLCSTFALGATNLSSMHTNDKPLDASIGFLASADDLFQFGT